MMPDTIVVSISFSISSFRTDIPQAWGRVCFRFQAGFFIPMLLLGQSSVVPDNLVHG